MNMVILFNRMTGVNMLDGNWESLLDRHYEKFKCLYFLFKMIDYKDLNFLSVKQGNDSLTVEIDFKKKKEMDNFVNNINDVKCDRYFDDFSIDYYVSKKSIDITIKTSLIEMCGDYIENIHNTIR